MIVTDHARQRILERIGCHESKILKIVKKALKSTEKIEKGDVANERMYAEMVIDRGEHQFYKKFMGLIFVFVTTRGDRFSTRLVTVCPRPDDPKNKRYKRVIQQRKKLNDELERDGKKLL
jgi:hypothetical protein